MGTTADKLQYLNGTKTAIKNAIVAKGVAVPDGTTFRAYAEKIGSIVKVPSLSNPGSASDLRSGKQLAGADGSVITGTLAEVTQATPQISVSSGGLITVSATQSGGIVAEGTKSSTKQLPTQAAKTVTPGTTNQTAVASGRYTTGDVKVAGDSNLVAENIAEGVSIFGVLGEFAGGGISDVRNIYFDDTNVDNLTIEPPTNYVLYCLGNLRTYSFNELVVVGKGQTVSLGQRTYSLSPDGATFTRTSMASGGGSTSAFWAVFALD